MEMEIETGTWILHREDKEAYSFSMVFCDKGEPLVPKNSHYCVNYQCYNNDDNETLLTKHYLI